MKRTVFIRLLLHLTIAVVIITLLVGALVYRNTDSLLKEEVLNGNAELLLQTQKIVEQALGEVQQMATFLALNTDVQKAVWLPWKLEEEYRFLTNTSDLFSDRITSSNYLHSIYLYSEANQKLISSSGLFDIADFPYRSGLQKFIDSMGNSAWEAGSWSAPGGNAENVISFLISVPLHHAKKKGVLIINLKENVLYNAVVNTNERKLGNMAILNSRGEVLSYKDKHMLLTRFDTADVERIQKEKQGYFIDSLNGTPTLVSFITSDFNGWIYITLNPYKEVFKRSNEVIKITLIISLLGLGIGIILMMLVSTKYYRPVQNVVLAIMSHMEKPPPNRTYQDEFSFIRESIRHLFQENEEFKNKFRTQEMILRDHFLVNLLSGKMTDEEETIHQLRYYHPHLQPEHFIVMVLRIHFDSQTFSRNVEPIRSFIHFQIRSICEHALAPYATGVYISQFHRQDQDVMIINTGQWKSQDLIFEKVKELAHRMTTAIKNELGNITVTVGIGGRYEKVTEIAISYNEAVEALLYERMAGKGSILFLYDMQVNRADRNRFIAYRQQTDKIVNELKSGNLDKALETKDELFRQLEGDTRFGFSYKYMILTHLLNGLAVVKIEMTGTEEKNGRQDKDDGWYFDFSKLQTLEEIRLWLNRILTDIANDLKHKREHKNIEVIEKLANYIREHYREPIGLQTLADLVLMNSQYVSKLFKEVTGRTFVEYLTEIRFREACRLLSETDKSVNEIAAETGFGQKQNLIRTFKKYTGSTPTEYRTRQVINRL